ncbi:glycoside hydrolase family 16 protein [Streptomyces sp. NPDC008222]|uniref:glycoside hydrolase family 16 protein n=1 Tax=Streptomyces sp. NPDC008222 TaxID=3364820 RepID=UPI0036ECBDF7
MLRRLAAVAIAAAALVGINATPTRAATTPSFHLVYTDGFNTPTKLGAFRDCNHNADTRAAYCAGLSGSVRANWWAYPAGWPDTATQRGYKVGGYYDPASTLWIAPSSSGDGQLHIRMWRGASGPVHSATIVPKAAMGLRYGKYEERFRVSHVATGYKSAHLLWPVDDDGCSEIDFPELEWDTQVAAFAHPSNCGQQVGVDTGKSWNQWHTSRIEWTPGRIVFLLDGKVVGSTTKSVPATPMDWDIQNESALNGESAAPNSWGQMDITYVKVWSWS